MKEKVYEATVLVRMHAKNREDARNRILGDLQSCDIMKIVEIRERAPSSC